MTCTRTLLLLLVFWLVRAADAGMPPMPTVVAPASRGVVRNVLPTVGTVRGVRDVKVGSKIAERVAAVLVDEGDQVFKDKTVLCTLDTTNSVLAIQEAKARLDEAKALLAKAVAGPRLQEIKEAEATVAGLKARVAKLEADLARSRKLLDTKVIAPSEFDAVVAERDVAKALVDAGAAKLALLREGSREEDIAKTRADVALRQAEHDLAEQRKSDSVIKSPVDGHVIAKLVEVGEWTQIGGTVMEIVDTSKLRVHTRVTEKRVRSIRRGMPVRMQLDAHPGRIFQGTVHRVVPKADDTTRSFPVQVDVLEPDGLVKPGMFARCEFVLDERKDVLLVPEDALVFRSGMAMVFTASPVPPPGFQMPQAPEGAAPPQPPGPPRWAKQVIVKTGTRQEGRMEISEIVAGSLKAGDLVVVVGTENMHEGSMMFVVGGLPKPPAGATPAQAPAKEAGSK